MAQQAQAAEEAGGPVVRLIDTVVQSLGSAGAPGERRRTALPLDAEVRAAVEALSTRARVDPATVLLAAWLLTLDRVRGDARVAINLSNLKAGASDRALDLQVPREGSTLDWLDRLRAPGLSGAPSTTEVECHWTAAMPAGAVFDAPLVVGIDAGLGLAADFATPPFEAASVLRLLQTWAHLLAAMTRQPEAPIAGLDMLSDAQRQQLLVECNRTGWQYRDTLVVAERFAQVVATHGARSALRWHGGALRYDQLHAASDALAARLQSAGVRHGDVVAVALGRSPLAIVAILAVLKAGGAYLPLDADYPRDRLEFMLDDAGVRLVLAPATTAERWPARLTQLRLDALDDVGTATFTPRSDLTGESLAYVMYTSGSTGTPKGVEIAQRSILRLVMDTRFMRLDDSVVMLHAAPLGFDASTLEIWGPLLNGGCCVLHDEDVPTGAGLARTIAAHCVTSAWLTAALFNAVVDDDPQHLAGLRELLTGGEALSVPHVRRAYAALPAVTLINGYGPTECTTFTTTHRIDRERDVQARSIPIGRPITETQVYILNRRLEAVPFGLVGELFVGGLGVGRGYLKRPELTAERFVPNPFDGGATRLYRTGDLVRYLDDGAIEFIGRADTQVKIRGFRIELGEIETALAAHPAVRACAVVARKDDERGTQLVAYVVAEAAAYANAGLRAFLAERLPEFMVPSVFMRLDALPVTTNGKLDRRALPAPARVRPDDLPQPYVAPATPHERAVAEAFAQVLGIDRGGQLDNFFELGGNSLLILRAIAQLRTQGHGDLPVALAFSDPTPRALAAALGGGADDAIDTRRLAARSTAPRATNEEPIAIVGMSGRFPGARDVNAFWRVLCEGRDTIRFFAPHELDAAVPAALRADAAYVSARGVIDDVEMFDAGFFGITPREAELMDPQQRIFLELCWEALEHAGHVPEKYAAPIGVFGGMYNATYYQRHVIGYPDKIARLGEFQVMLANEKDYVATRVAHKLNLTGPAISVHTACSTSLVAIAQAFESLRAGQCGMALAGGASVTCPPNSGYLYQEGAMLSPDGHTRTFDADAQGTVFSDGAAVVLLKRLSDAIADGNPVYAVIRGVAVNNDGGDKASFTAPSVDGQAAVVAAALDRAGVDARSISYVEAHGTATPLGDPVEVAALTRAFRRDTQDAGFCAIGSTKSNMGHLVIAAGATGLIKTALALTHETLPAVAHFKKPNPKIEFEASPFRVVATQTAWPRGTTPRCAGVSAFGVGGTNAHVVVEEAPLREASSAAQGPQLLRVSARSRAALEVALRQLGDHLAAHPDTNLADVAHTLDVGRRDFAHRSFVVADDAAAAAVALHDAQALQRARQADAGDAPVVLLFTGQGAQYAGMGRGLYEADATFRAALDEALAAVQSAGVLTIDLKALMFGDDAEALARTEFTQPATFCLEVALARTWLARGLEPALMIGHSVGEFTAAVVAGVMSLVDAARLVARRGQLMQAQPAGSMLSVRQSAEQVAPLLPATLQLAAENSPNACVVAGPTAEIEAFAAELAKRDIVSRALQTSHAFHSAMMDAAVEPFAAEVAKVALAAPRIPIVSTLTGALLRDDEATDARYWARHLRETVRFSTAVRSALAQGARCFVEVGPRGTLATLARQHAGSGKDAAVAVASLADAAALEATSLAAACGQLWTLGLAVRVPTATGRRARLVLPTYPFERQRHWLEAVQLVAPLQPAPAASAAQPVATPVATATLAVAAAPAVPATPITPSDTSSTTAMTTTATTDRRPSIVKRLRTVFEDVSGIELEDADASANFVELGLDSLTLTQVALQLKKDFGVNITFRQLMESLRSFDDLAQFLDGQMPADAAPAVAAAAPAPVAAAAPMQAPVQPQSAPAMAALPAMPAMMAMPALSAASAPLVQQIIAQQMQLMANQLALLAGGGMAALPQATAVEPQAAVTPAPVAVAAAVPAEAAKPATPAAATPAGAQPLGIMPLAEDASPTDNAKYDVKKAFGAIARIHTSGTELTERQRARLDAFMRRYIDKTKASKAYTVEHRPHMADPRVVNGFRPALKEIIYQIVIERSKGSHMWDLDGNEYVDALNGFGMSLFGWQPDFVLNDLRKQLDSGYDIGPQHPLAGEVSKLFCEVTGNDRAALCNTGSEAVMGCVRIARTVTGRSKIAIFNGAYHGIFDEVIVRGTKKLKSIPAAPGIMPNTSENVLVLDYGTPESLQILKDRAHELAAILVEPVQSRRPDFQPREFLRELRTLTEQSGTVLIFDEVVTGFRSHPGGIQALFGIRADLASYGKVVGGGFPIGVIAGKREFMDALDGGQWQYGDDSIPTVGVTYFAGTFVRHPLALVAAKAVLEHVKREGPEMQATLTRSTAAMVDELNAFCREVGAPIVLKSFSSVWKVFFTEDHPMQDLLFAMMRNRGVHILDNFPCFMTTAHTANDIAVIKTAFKEAVAELQEAEFLPRKPVVASATFDASRPPVPGARLGKEPDGRPAWFVANPEAPGKYMKVVQ